MDQQTTNVVPPNEPVAQPPTAPKPQSKFPLLLGLLLLVLLLVGGAYYLGTQKTTVTALPSPASIVTATPDPTVNWKTYSNDTYGFSLKYPSEYQDVYLRMNQNDNYDNVLNLTATTSTFKISVIHDIDIYEHVAIEVVAGREVNDSGVPHELSVKPIGSYQAAFVTLKSDPPTTQVYIAKPDTNVYVVLTFTSNDTSTNDTFDQILSTFKFVLSDGELKTMMQGQIRPALELYRADNGQYPQTLDLLAPQFLTAATFEPLTSDRFTYEVSADKLNYTMTLKLQDGTTFTLTAP